MTDIRIAINRKDWEHEMTCGYIPSKPNNGSRLSLKEISSNSEPASVRARESKNRKYMFLEA
jgi:hypothetical protein